jgi:hypothetical protein
MSKRGSKAHLSPRVPAARKLFKLGKFVNEKLPDGTERRVWVHQDFAPPAVVEALASAGWKRRFDETADRMDLEVGLGPSELDGIPDHRDISNKIPDPVDVAFEAGPSEISEIDLLELSNDIRHVVADYISDARYQQSPKKFRPGAKSFHKTLKAAVAKFPSAESEHVEALNLELEKLDLEDVPDIEHCRTVIRALLEASERVQANEAGPGADADRAKHLLVAGLARIYEERTGRRPARGFDLYADKPHAAGLFFTFVTAVNELLPVPLRLSDIDGLIRAHLKQ